MKLFLPLYPHSACGQILILEKSEKTITHNPDTLCHSSKKALFKSSAREEGLSTKPGH